MPAPVARTWPAVSPLTVAAVATGMKAGVATSPWAVASRPALAAPSRARQVQEKVDIAAVCPYGAAMFANGTAALALSPA